jgi:hypothetical protein
MAFFSVEQVRVTAAVQAVTLEVSNSPPMGCLLMRIFPGWASGTQRPVQWDLGN